MYIYVYMYICRLPLREENMVDGEYGQFFIKQDEVWCQYNALSNALLDTCPTDQHVTEKSDLTILVKPKKTKIPLCSTTDVRLLQVAHHLANSLILGMDTLIGESGT